MQSRQFEVAGEEGRKRPFFVGAWFDRFGTEHYGGMSDVLVTPTIRIADPTKRIVVVAQLGAHRPVVQKLIGKWPEPNHFIPVCQPAKWERLPLRVTIQPTGGEAITYDVVGTADWRGSPRSGRRFHGHRAWRQGLRRESRPDPRCADCRR